jgi:hypothetical protein
MLQVLTNIHNVYTYRATTYYTCTSCIFSWQYIQMSYMCLLSVVSRIMAQEGPKYVDDDDDDDI